MRTLLAAFSFVTLIILLSDCQGKFPERCDHYYDADCGNLCPEGCPDTCCCGDCDVDTCLMDPNFECEGCCCEVGVTCAVDTCVNLPGFVCEGWCCIEGVECKTDTAPEGACLPPTTWEALYGGDGDDEGWGIIQTADGNFVITGRYNDTQNANDNVFLWKIYDDGTSKWFYHTVYGDIDMDDEYGTDLMELDNEDLVIQGNKNKDGDNWQFYLIRTDRDGTPAWKSDIFGLGQVDLGFSIVPRTELDGYLMYGYTGTYHVNDAIESIVYAALDGGGESTRKNIGESLDDYGSCIEVAHDGNYLLLTTIGTSATSSKLVLYKLDKNLTDILWETEIISNCIPQQRACVRKIGDAAAGTGDPSYVIAAAPVTGAMRVIGVNADGDVLDFLSFSDIIINQSVSVIPTSDGGFAALSDNMTLVKIKEDFSEDWRMEFNGGESRGVHSLIQAKDKGFVMTGLRDVGGNTQVLVIKTDSLGVVEQQ